jgi:hypothetical protein
MILRRDVRQQDLPCRSVGFQSPKRPTESGILGVINSCPLEKHASHGYSYSIQCFSGWTLTLEAELKINAV